MQLLQVLLPPLTPVATLAVVLVRISYNNSRVGDVSKRIDDMRDLLRAEMSNHHSELLHKFAELDNRLVRMER